MIAKGKDWKFDKKDMRLIPKVEITWDDACTSGKWRSLKDYQSIDLMECKAIGYLTKKTKKLVQVVQQISDEGLCSDSVTLPASCVKKIRRLK